MQTEFVVEIEIDIEYEVGSPPDREVDPYSIADVAPDRYPSVWMTREGPSEGVITDGTSALYPPFTDVLRRQVFCIIQTGTSYGATVTWNAESFPLHRIFLTTDEGWNATSVAVSSLGEGSWWACEGELMTEFRVTTPGTSGPFPL